jgi:hypothetical protein
MAMEGGRATSTSASASPSFLGFPEHRLIMNIIGKTNKMNIAGAKFSGLPS